MQRYTDKVYQRTSKIQESPLFEVIQEELHLQNSYCALSNAQSFSIQTSRGFPVTINKQKCRNCQRLERSLTLLANQLLAIEKNILEKEDNLDKILADKSQTIELLQAKLQNLQERSYSNHFSSTFYTEVESKHPLHNQIKVNVQDNKQSFSLISDKKNAKHSFVSAFNLDVLPHKNRQKTQARYQNQNIPPNSQNNGRDKLLHKLKFENETLKNYNSTLLALIDKLKRSRF